MRRGKGLRRWRRWGGRIKRQERQVKRMGGERWKTGERKTGEMR